MNKNFFVMRVILAATVFLLVGGPAIQAQDAASQDNTAMYQGKRVPIYRVTVVSRTIKAVNYRHRSEQTKVDFRGTALLPEATGNADVQSKQGAIRVEANFRHMAPASRFGPDYMTYVLWAISPEGRAVNLGEVLPDNNGNSKLQVTSDLQSFGMIVTAEPHFAVTRPSDAVVMENFVTNDTNGTIEEVDAKYELLKRGEFVAGANQAELQPIILDDRTPIEIYEARNAVRIARWAGAEQYAPESLQKAETDLQNAESFLAHKGNRKDMITDAREAAQMAEDAREITIRKIDAADRAHERQTATDAQATAATESAAAADARAHAERAEHEKAEADAQKRAAEAQADQAQQAAEQARLNAQQSQQQASQAEAEKAALRAKLLEQLNAVLATRDSARGLIVNISGVLFDTAKSTLKPGAREKLAKVSGILLAHPGLILEVDGYTAFRTTRHGRA